MINLFTLCGIAVISVIIIIILKRLKSDFALPLALFLGIILLRQAFLILQEKEAVFKTIFEGNSFSQYGNVIIKAFGISIIIELLSDFCKEAGEKSIATKIELLGKIEIIVLSLPLVEKVLEIVRKIIF